MRDYARDSTDTMGVMRVDARHFAYAPTARILGNTKYAPNRDASDALVAGWPFVSSSVHNRTARARTIYGYVRKHTLRIFVF